MLDPRQELTTLLHEIHTKKYAGMDNMKGVETLNPAFACVTGSWNYGLADKDSDVDVKIAYFPTFDHFYDNEFPKHAVVTNVRDFTTAPLHQVVEHMLKGNINFLELAYSKYTWTAPEVERVFEIARKIIPMNAIRMIMACVKTAEQKMTKLHKYSEGTEKYGARSGYNTKEVTHAVRQLYFLHDYLHTGEINLDSHMGMRVLKDIRLGAYTEERAIKTYEEAKAEVDNLIYGNYKEGSKFSKRVHTLDRTESEKWVSRNESMDKLVKTLIKANI